MKRLKKWLSEHDVTQTEFASSLHVSQPTVSEWLAGISNPRASTVARISEQTGIPVEDLIEDCAKNTQRRDAKQTAA